MGRFVYTRENLRKMQLIELEMLRELDRICRKNNISYILDGGTLLGAVRYGGFIPWDDDIDVRMLRGDYDKFCEICKTQLSEDYFLQTYQTDPGYRWGYARILKNGTVYKRKGQHKMTARNGIFIDIFPDDNLPETFIANKICTYVSWICRKILYSEVGVRNKQKFSSWLGFYILNLFPKEWGHRGMEYLSRKYRNITTTRVRCLAWGSKAETGGYQKKWDVETKDIVFEGLTVRAPKDIEGFLTYNFGADYMTPPPKEKRKPVHIADYIDFGEFKVLEHLKGKKIVIYGTGHVARKFYKALHSHALQDRVRCFVRSGAVNAGEQFEGVPVHCFADVHIGQDDLVCLAVHESLRDEIEKTVRKKTKQYLWIYPYLYQLLLGEPKQTNVAFEVKQLLESFRHDLRLGVRLAAIEQRLGINTFGDAYYVRAQMLHCSKETATQRLKQFWNVIDRWKQSGYEKQYMISTNQNYGVIDGNHRLALAVYFGQQTIYGNIYPTNLPVSEIHGQEAMLSEELLSRNGFSEDEIQRLKTIQERYLKAYGIE